MVEGGEHFDDIDEVEAEVTETWANDLVGQALDIVRSESLIQCVQAGPGTGKSFCMTKRVLRLLQQRKIVPSQVLAVTFTRTAANDLRRSLESMLPEEFKGFRASTLHSLCNEILSKPEYLQARGRSPRSLLTASKSSNYGFEAHGLLKDLGSFGTATLLTKKIRAFEAAWARRQKDPLGAPEDGGDAAFGAELLAWLKFHGAILIGELLPLAYEYLSSEPGNYWRSKFKAVSVDEYQDLNKVDQAVVGLISENAVTTVVGDLDQSIYSFRNAHPEGLTEFAARHDVERFSMEKSRRCPTKHLSISQLHIKQNRIHA